MKIIDISVPVDKNTTLWPGNSGIKLERLASMSNGGAHNETLIRMNAHVGTHVDAPRHFVAKGKSIDKLNPEMFVGKAYVAPIKNSKAITREDLEKADIPNGVERVLFKTANRKLFGIKKFNKRYVGLTPDAAKWIAERKIRLVGIDYLSIAKFSDAREVHRILLGNEVAILEGLNLSKVKQGTYMLVSLPIMISDIEASPARAILLES